MKFMAFHLVLAGVGLLAFAIFASWGNTGTEFLLRLGLVYAALDLFATVAGKPLVKAGPIAKALYCGLRDE